MTTLSQFTERAGRAAQYRQERADMRYRALDVWHYLNGDDPLAANLEQFTCRHQFAIDETSDRCYCLNCGLDGDA